MTVGTIEKLQHFFIIGRGRSGTTLLQSLLDTHPQVVIPIESRYVIHLFEKYHSIQGLTESTVDEFLDDLFTEVKINFWNLNVPELRKNLVNLGPEAIYGDICKCIALSYNDAYLQDGIRLIGDKNPIHTLFLNKIVKLFPRAKFIHLVRDYRDNALSHRQTFGENNLKVQGYLWNLFTSAAERLGKKYPERYLRVHYEQLAKEPETVLQNITSFLGIDYHANMLEFHVKGKERHKGLEPIINMVHPTLFRPVNESAVQKWKSKLTTEEIKELDQICYPVASDLGYNPDSQIIPKTYNLSRFRANVQIKLMRFLYSISIPNRIRLMKILANIFKSPVNEFIKEKEKALKN